LVESEKIPYKSNLKTNPSLKEVVEISQTADLIIADEKFDESPLGQHRFSLNKLKNKVSVPFHIIEKTY
jgi:hypothetical protein